MTAVAARRWIHDHQIAFAPTAFSPTLQVNVEYLQLDSRSFVTGEDRALALLFGAASDENIEARVAVKRIAQRLATLFATLKVPPFAAVACCRPRPVVMLAAPKDDRILSMERLAEAGTSVASALQSTISLRNRGC